MKIGRECLVKEVPIIQKIGNAQQVLPFIFPPREHVDQNVHLATEKYSAKQVYPTRITSALKEGGTCTHPPMNDPRTTILKPCVSHGRPMGCLSSVGTREGPTKNLRSDPWTTHEPVKINHKPPTCDSWVSSGLVMGGPRFSRGWPMGDPQVIHGRSVVTHEAVQRINAPPADDH